MTKQAKDLADAPLKQLPSLAEMARAAEGIELSDAQVMKLFNDVINGSLWFCLHPELLGAFRVAGECGQDACRVLIKILIERRDAYAKRIAGDEI